MAAAVHCLSSSCLSLHAKFNTLSLTNSSSSSSFQPSFRPLGFSSNLSLNVFSRGHLSMNPVDRKIRGGAIVCEATPKKKVDSAVKRARQAEKRRIYNKSRKSEIKTRMKKVLEALDVLMTKPDPQPDEVFPIEKLIGEAYSVIDKAVKVGTLHRKTGARRKSRLARRKKAVEVCHGWYTPTPTATAS